MQGSAKEQTHQVDDAAQEKVIQPGALTKTQFDSRVEDLSWKLRTVNVKLAGLEPSTPTADESDQTVIE